MLPCLWSVMQSGCHPQQQVSRSLTLLPVFRMRFYTTSTWELHWTRYIQAITPSFWSVLIQLWMPFWFQTSSPVRTLRTNQSIVTLSDLEPCTSYWVVAAAMGCFEQTPSSPQSIDTYMSPRQGRGAKWDRDIDLPSVIMLCRSLCCKHNCRNGLHRCEMDEQRSFSGAAAWVCSHLGDLRLPDWYSPCHHTQHHCLATRRELSGYHPIRYDGRD